MNVTLDPKNGINGKSHRKEKNFTAEYALIVFKDGELRTPLVIRLYNTSSRTYACLWFNETGKHCTGSGYAGGGNYNLASEAVQNALTSAGFTLTGETGKVLNIGGLGDNKIEEFMNSVAVHILKVADQEHFHIHKANG